MKSMRGLYKHQKSGRLYRVLFTGHWDSRAPEDNEEIFVVCDRNNQILCFAPHNYGKAQKPGGPYALLFMANWSGNDDKVAPREEVVVYVALYDAGRLSVRSKREFNEEVEFGNNQRGRRFVPVEGETDV